MVNDGEASGVGHSPHLLECEGMTVYNVMEEVVHDVLMQYKSKLQLGCNCDRCMDDIQALALNGIEPRYIVKKEYGPYVRAAHEADHQGATNILSTVIKAASIVSASPRCAEKVVTTDETAEGTPV